MKGEANKLGDICHVDFTCGGEGAKQPYPQDVGTGRAYFCVARYAIEKKDPDVQLEDGGGGPPPVRFTQKELTDEATQHCQAEFDKEFPPKLK